MGDKVQSLQHGGALFVLLVVLMAMIAISDDTADPSVAASIERTVAETSVPLPTTAPTTTVSITMTAAPTTMLAAVDEPAEPTTTTTTASPTTRHRSLASVTFESLERIDTIQDYTALTTQGISRWRRSIDGLEELDLVSTADGTEQPVLWLPPRGDHDQPVLVILHSWSSRYTQHAGIPFAQWAQENGWAVIAPEFRGKNDDANAVGSELAVQDVADAIDHAVAQEGVDASRVFVVGYSGGGMMALLVAGQHPEKVAAVSSWGHPTTSATSTPSPSRTASGIGATSGRPASATRATKVRSRTSA